ncbi:MAG TPA: sigma-70 family RNA polymerase sigma factor [Rudaea sp.]
MAAPTECIDALLIAARGGDRGAQQRLYAHCVPILRRWAGGWLPWPHRGINDADDLVQIALMRAWRRFDDFDLRGSASFFAYLHRILRNEVCAELRRCQVRGVTVACDEAMSDGGDPAVEGILAIEREHLLAQALRRLDRRQRRHLDMRLRLGMSFAEIAERTGGNPDSVRMLVTRAVRTIAARLAAA